MCIRDRPTTGVLDAATIQAIYDRGVVTGSTTTTTTAPPATTVPATAPPATEPPATTPPATPPPATDPPATEPPATDPPETAPPATDPPAPEQDNLFLTLQADPDFSTFVELLIAAGFTADTEIFGQHTLFAPTNDAFAAVDPADLAAIKADPERLRQILAYHVVEGRLLSAALVGELETLNGTLLRCEGSGPTLTVGGAPVVKPDVEASNGVIHGIGTLLQPPIVPV